MNNRLFDNMLNRLISAECSCSRALMERNAAEARAANLERQIHELKSNPPDAPAIKLSIEELTDLMMGDRAKIQAIKTIRTLTRMGLKESKDLLEAAVARAEAKRGELATLGLRSGV